MVKYSVTNQSADDKDAYDPSYYPYLIGTPLKSCVCRAHDARVANFLAKALEKLPEERRETDRRCGRERRE